ncbi:hypothetical protein M0R45_016782 [Rubus argutus]|uniref:Uncharacterized protein n=1 Tax=Rubus argutus TaxID=59490 RepID=A0AAW1XTH1_RUBAR
MVPSPLHTAELNSSPSHQFKTGCNLTVHTTRSHGEPVNSPPSTCSAASTFTNHISSCIYGVQRRSQLNLPSLTPSLSSARNRKPKSFSQQLLQALKAQTNAPKSSYTATLTEPHLLSAHTTNPLT